jgi:hypothetical protein
MARRLIPIGVGLLTLGVLGYGWATSGRLTAAVIFLALTALSLSWALYLMARAAQALVREPEGEEEVRATGRRRKELEREKQSLLKALKELAFDYEMGKVSEADYKEIGGNYRSRAVRVLRQLDAKEGDADYRALVERELAHRVQARRGAPVAAAPKPGRPTCARCSTENDSDAEFCKKCGARLAADEVRS